MKLILTAEEQRVLTAKVLKHSRTRVEEKVPVRVCALPANLLGRLCGEEEIRVEVDKQEKPKD